MCAIRRERDEGFEVQPIEEQHARASAPHCLLKLDTMAQAFPRRKSSRGRKAMDSEERHQVSERMTKYWAIRREKGSSPDGARIGSVLSR